METSHTLRCLKVVVKKNFILKARSWVSTLLEMLLPVALMLLLIWIRTEITKKYEPAKTYINSPANNPTWFSASPGDNLAGLNFPQLIEPLIPLCNGTNTGLCPEIFANATWPQRKERFLGMAIDGILLLHMALYNQVIGVVGSEGLPLAQFIENLPGYRGYVKTFTDEDKLADYIADSQYGFDPSKPQLFGAIIVKETATKVNGKLSGTYDIVINLNATGPGSVDINGATDVNSGFSPPVNPLTQSLQISNTKIYWSGGLFTSSGVPFQTGGLVDLEALIYSWIYNTTETFTFPQDLPKCQCQDDQGQLTEDFKQCKDIKGAGQLELLVRLLTPSWSTSLLNETQRGCAGRFSSLNPLSVREVPFPTSAHIRDTFAQIVESVFGLFFVLMFIWPLTRIMKSLVEDKEERINEVMKMMRMPAEAITFGWYITYGILWGFTAFMMVAICYSTVFEHSNKLIVFLFFWFFGMCVITFCSLIAIFFARAKTASVTGALVFFLLYFPYQFVSGATISSSSKQLSCLAPPTALSFGAALIAQLESAGEGAQWGNLNLMVDNFSLGRVLFMEVFDTLLFAALAWYLDKVFVAGFGTRLPCCFFCTRRYWFPTGSGLTATEAHDLEEAFDDTAPRNTRFEPVGEALSSQRSVLIRDLSREFSTADGKILKAVDGLTVNLYNGQIFCLLGHNGAGKTTTINMLSGMLPVSGGDAIMYGKSVKKDMQTIRKMLGVCPQHDVIWGMLTVREHLEFFAELKGVAPDNIPAEVNEIIGEVGLREKESALAGTMSGGQKRRLSAAIALIGGSKVVFLDEPSSGVDPFSRRELWDCLANKKDGRTLILTTHFMDEAEQLGDRIAIMAAGQVKCVGSSLFLKSQYGVGYTLTIAKRANSTPEQAGALKDVVSKTCSSSELLSDVGSEIAFRMPMSQSRLFPQLFEHFENDPDKYGVDFFSVSVTTLEEVFLRVGQDHTEADLTATERRERTSFGRQLSTQSQLSANANQATTAPPSATAGRLGNNEAEVGLLNEDLDLTGTGASEDWTVFFRHTHALLAKRYHNSKRDKKAWCCQIGMPLIFLLAALSSMKFQGVGSYPVAPLNLDNMAEAGKQEVVYAAGLDANETLTSQFMEGFEDSMPISMAAQTGIKLNKLNTSGFDNWLLDHFNRSGGLGRYGAYRFQYVPDYSKPTETKTVGDFTVAGCGTPGAVTTNLPLLPKLDVPVGTLWDETVILPNLTRGKHLRAGRFLEDVSVPMSELNNRLQVDIFWNSSARDAIPVFYHKLQQQLLRTVTKAFDKGDVEVKIGNQPFPLTAAQKSLTDSVASLNIALGFAFIPATFGAFVVLERETKSKHLQITCGVNFISYWLATWLWDIINYLVPAVLSLLLIILFDVKGLIGAANVPWTVLSLLLYGVCCSSFTYMVSFLFNSHTAAQNILLVIYLFTGGILEIVAIILGIIPNTMDLMNNVLIYIFRLLPNFALADALTNLITRSVPLTHVGCPAEGCAPNALQITGWDIIYMGLGALVWFVITLFLELALATPRLRAIFQLQNVDVDADTNSDRVDPDVQSERRRVESGEADSETVVLRGLRKVYPGRSGLAPKVAVNDMFFGIPEGQCFGYLGMNGAGKTTTMKILTGEELCTRGGATLGGFDVMTQQNQVRKLIGYCPQFDALIGSLTAREHLMLFARIKGLPKDRIRGYVDRMLDRLTLTQFADRQAYTFSGGTRRKLSLGIALVGNPRIVFLDEPTTGVDPESRRFMWKLISTTMQGRSVILTTHSMDECEALCSRIGIMVNGALVCLGSASHLKAVHGSGFRFEVTFQATADFKAAFKRLEGFLAERFQGGARCIEGHMPADAPSEAFRQRVTYKMPKTGVPISAIFREVEESREKLEISEYAISETTLDQIFIQFAKHQWDETQDGEPVTLGASTLSTGSFTTGAQVEPALAPAVDLPKREPAEP